MSLRLLKKNNIRRSIERCSLSHNISPTRGTPRTSLSQFQGVEEKVFLKKFSHQHSLRVNFLQNRKNDSNTFITVRALNSAAKPSYSRGNTHPALLKTSIGAAFDQFSQKTPDREVLYSHHQNLRLSWKGLSHRVDHFAKGLMGLGYQKGDRLAVWLPNCAEWLIAQFATAKLGVLLVTLNPSFKIDEVLHCWKEVEPKGVITMEAYKQNPYRKTMVDLKSKFPFFKHVISINSSYGEGNDSDVLPFEDVELLGLNQTLPDPSTIFPDDGAQIQFTSGTTGYSKPVELTHIGLLNNGKFVGDYQRLTDSDVVCIPVPLFHCFGNTLGNIAALSHGSKIVYPNWGFTAESVLEVLAQEKVSALLGVPTMFLEELHHPKFHPKLTSSLRTGIMAGSICPSHLLTQLIEKCGMRDVTVCYGLTEASPVVSQTKTYHNFEKKTQTVGIVHPHVELKIVDENNETVPVGQPGELLVSGYNIMKGYYNRPEDTSKVMKDNWLHTGDLAILDEDGFLKISGRKKDLIIRGGENISPKEVEDAIYKFPQVKDVSVIGIPDERLGEVVCAWVIPKDKDSFDQDALLDFLKEHLAHFKIPKHVLLTDDFPLTGNGKVRKVEMREQTPSLLKQREEGKSLNE